MIVLIAINLMMTKMETVLIMKMVATVLRMEMVLTMAVLMIEKVVGIPLTREALDSQR